VRQWVPRVRIVTPAPDKTGATPNILTNIEVDGAHWPIVDYRIDGNVNDLQHVTLTFLADVTIEHQEKK